MSMWRSSRAWQPPQFGWMMPAEWPPFVVWLLPAFVGLVAMIASQSAGESNLAQPTRLDQLGLFGDYWIATLLYSPLWSFPAVLAGLLMRSALLGLGCFGWAGAIAGGAMAGLAVPVFLGAAFWLDGPLYGVVFLLGQYLIYCALYGPDFYATSDI